MSAGGEAGKVYLDLGKPLQRRAPWLGLVVLVEGVAIAIAAGFLVNWVLGGAIVVGTVGCAVVLVLMMSTGKQQLCANGIVAPGQFVAWNDLTTYRFWDAGLDFTFATSSPLYVSEVAGGLQFPVERRPEVEALFTAMAPHARRFG